MCLVIYAGQVLKVQMRINLGGGDVGMAQQFLYGTQILAGLKQVAGKRMSQRVWMNPGIDAESLAPGFHPGLD